MIAEQNGFQKSGDSVHAYDREGNPRHSAPYKDKKRAGEMRPTTLRDIKENGWLPSVSSILSIMEKKGLDKWKRDQIIDAAWAVHQEVGYEYWKQYVIEEAESRMTRARDLGTEIHGAIERHLASVSDLGKFGHALPVVGSHSRCVEAAVAALKELGVWGYPFAAERTFSSPLGFGGTIDYQSVMFVGDFKCVDRLDKKLAYDDRCAQLCAYFIGGSRSPQAMEEILDQVHLANIFISTSEPGKYLIHEWSTEEKERGWEMFKACLNLWQIVNNYRP